jgi:hypothetical protein
MKSFFLFVMIANFIYCGQNRQLDLEPYGLNATISCEGHCAVHTLDLVVAREITIGNELDRLQALILKNYESTIAEALIKQQQSAKAEMGFERFIEEKDSFFVYEYRFDDEVFTQFRQLYIKDSILVILRAHPKNRLHYKQAKLRWQQAATMKWKE